MWSNVHEQITDGTSGLTPNSQPPVLFVGACSKGPVNKPLIFGRKSAVSELLGYGALTQAVSDCQKNMADVSIIATTAAAEIPGSLEFISQPAHGDAVLSGEPSVACRARIEMTGSGEVEVLWEGAKNAKERVLIPENREIVFEDLGVSFLVPQNAALGDVWVWKSTAPTATLEALRAAFQRAMDLYTPEAVFICQNSNAGHAAFWSAEAENYFSGEHKPVHFVLESALDPTLPTYEEAISAKTEEFCDTDARFVSVLCQPGMVADGSLKHERQPMGFLAASITQSSVGQSIGATRYFAVPNFVFPEGWNNSHSRSLDEARFITLRNYAGLNGIFWSNGRTLAGSTSDYRFIEIVRTVHKAVRLARNAVLLCVHAPGDERGVKEVLARIRSALVGMTSSLPAELLGFDLAAPEGQDIVNKGLVVEISLYGVPIIRTITLNFMYKYQEAA